MLCELSPSQRYETEGYETQHVNNHVNFEILVCEGKNIHILFVSVP